MKDRFDILLSSGGRRVALLDILRQSLRDLELSGEVLVSEISPLSATYHHADHGLLVPRCTNPEFIPTVLDLCRRMRVRLIIPTIDTELPVFAANREAFAAEGIRVVVSAPEVIAIAGDKVRTHAFLTDQGIPTVRQRLAEDWLHRDPGWEFPLIVKPRGGSLSKGVRIVESRSELESAVRAGGFIVQTIAPGEEYTIDCLVNERGRLACAVPRKRLEVRGGEISKGITVRSSALQSVAARVCEALPAAYGCLNVQVFLDAATGELNVIEVNARFGGGFPLSWQAGAHFPRWIIEEQLGLPPSGSSNGWRDGLVMLRFDDAVFVDAAAAGLGS